MKFNRLSIIVPVFNEEHTLEQVLSQLNSVNAGTISKQIIVVDDGSTDNTPGLLRQLKKKFSHNFLYIRHRQNYGKGAAVITGLKYSKGDYVIVQDSDWEYDPRDIVRLVNYAIKNKSLAVFGNRNGAVKNVFLYPHYYWGSKIISLLIFALFGSHFADPETCYKLVQTKVMRSLRLRNNDFAIEIEIVCKLAILKIPIAEVPIRYVPRSFADGKKIRAKDGLKALFLVMLYYIQHFGKPDKF